MDEKENYELDARAPSKSEVRMMKRTENLENAKRYICVTSSAFLLKLFKMVPSIYLLYCRLPCMKPQSEIQMKYFQAINEKILAIHTQNFELAASCRNEEKNLGRQLHELQMNTKYQFSASLLKNGKIWVGVFLVENGF